MSEIGIIPDCGCFTTPYDYGDHGIILCPLHGAAPRLLEACKDFLEAIEFLGHARMASDMMASDLEYDGEGDQWRGYVEPCLLDPYDKAQAVLALVGGAK